MFANLRHAPQLITPENSPIIFTLDSQGSYIPLQQEFRDRLEFEDAIKREEYRIRENLIRSMENRELIESQIPPMPYSLCNPTHRKIVTKCYKSNVKVWIEGTEPEVDAVLEVLHKYPPRGPRYLQVDSTYTDLVPGSCKVYDNTAIPEIGVKTQGDHLIVTLDGVDYSGSGSIVFFVEGDKDTADLHKSNIYAALFRDTEIENRRRTDTQIRDYDFLGGRIDKILDRNKDILLKNAIKESKEESADLFHIQPHSDDVSIDVDTDTGHHKYRVYVYIVATGNITRDQLRQYYDSNVRHMTTATRSLDYRETDGIEFIRLEDLENRTNILPRNTSRANFMASSGSITLRGRAIRTLQKLFENNAIYSMIDKSRLRELKSITSGSNVVTYEF